MKEIKDKIGEDKYKEAFEKTDKILASLELTGSYARYNERLNDVVQSRHNEYRPTARERESGVDVTALVKGEIKFRHLYKKNNLELLRQECYFRNIENTAILGWRDMIAAIQEQERQHWLENNPNTTLPNKMKKPQAFRPLSGVEFILKH